MSVLEYIEETNPPEVRELLTAAHHFLREILPPFATCAIKWRIGKPEVCRFAPTHQGTADTLLSAPIMPGRHMAKEATAVRKPRSVSRGGALL
jgi:hypothetical protein